MTFARDPNARRRVDGQAQRDRDAEVARMRGDRVPFRRIAEELNMSLGGVQESLRRSQKRRSEAPAVAEAKRLTAAMATGEPGDVIAAAIDAELKCADVQSVEDCERLSGLEKYRLMHASGPWGDWARARGWSWATADRSIDG